MITLCTILINLLLNISLSTELNSSNTLKEDHNKTLVEFVSVLRHQTILTKLQTTAEKRQGLGLGGWEDNTSILFGA